MDISDFLAVFDIIQIIFNNYILLIIKNNLNNLSCFVYGQIDEYFRFYIFYLYDLIYIIDVKALFKSSFVIIRFSSIN